MVTYIRRGLFLSRPISVEAVTRVERKQPGVSDWLNGDLQSHTVDLGVDCLERSSEEVGGAEVSIVNCDHVLKLELDEESKSKERGWYLGL